MISFCPDCGKSIEAAFKFCPYCGKPLPTEQHEAPQTFVRPLVSSFRGSRRERNPSSETSPKKVKWSGCVTSPTSSLFSDGDSSGSEDTLSPCERPKGSRSKPPTPKSSPQTTKRSPQTLKRSRVTISLEALPTGTVLTDKNGRHWKLGSLQTRNDQGILYEAEPVSTFARESSSQKQRFSLKLETRTRGGQKAQINRERESNQAGESHPPAQRTCIVQSIVLFRSLLASPECWD
uniref:VRK serine/threonine kinase 3 n=1 Tax=Equus caballus TaxID=9796 RepID=F6UVY9_HORSE